jgi:hypothetical protein
VAFLLILVFYFIAQNIFQNLHIKLSFLSLRSISQLVGLSWDPLLLLCFYNNFLLAQAPDLQKYVSKVSVTGTVRPHLGISPLF